jgi:hypothetical protein
MTPKLKWQRTCANFPIYSIASEQVRLEAGEAGRMICPGYAVSSNRRRAREAGFLAAFTAQNVRGKNGICDH